MTEALIIHWEDQLKHSLKAVEVAKLMLERLYLDSHPQLELGHVAVNTVVDTSSIVE